MSGETAGCRSSPEGDLALLVRPIKQARLPSGHAVLQIGQVVQAARLAGTSEKSQDCGIRGIEGAQIAIGLTQHFSNCGLRPGS